MKTEAKQTYASGRWVLCCPSCDCRDVMIGNVSYFKPHDEDSLASDYYRLDDIEGVVASVIDEPTRRVEGRVLSVECFGMCGHHFTVMFQCVNGSTEMCEVSTGKILHVGPCPREIATPLGDIGGPVPISPAMWLRFLHEMREENDVTYSTLMVAVPLQPRKRHMVFCFAERSIATAEYMKNNAVRAHILRKLGKIIGGTWTMEVLTSDVLDG